MELEEAKTEASLAAQRELHSAFLAAAASLSQEELTGRQELFCGAAYEFAELSSRCSSLAIALVTRTLLLPLGSPSSSSEVILTVKAPMVEDLQSQLVAMSSQFDKYKKRSEQTIKLSAKDLETLRAEQENLSRALHDAKGALSESQLAVAQRDIAIATLERQVEELSSVAQQLQDRIAAFEDTAAPNPVKSLGSSTKEWEAHEADIREHYAREMSEMAAQHESEIERLREELGCANAHRLLPRTDGCRAAGGEDDEAYRVLLAELDTTRKSCEWLRAEKQRLENQVAAINSTQQCQRGASGNGGAEASHVRELERQLKAQAEQLWAVNEQLLELRASGTSPKNGSVSGTQQQGEYLRSVLVKLLCARSDDVRAGLVPVLATILQLHDADLKAIYTSNPTWATRH